VSILLAGARAGYGAIQLRGGPLEPTARTVQSIYQVKE
jgi:hypothetical protein